MFNKKETSLQLQIKVYMGWCVRHDNKCGTYHFWLNEFSKYYQGEAYDISDEDIDEFLTDMSVLYNGQHALDQARRALEGLRRFYVARNHNLESSREIGYGIKMRSKTAPKDERNRELILKRHRNPELWTWRALGHHFNIHWTTAEGIYARLAHKYIPQKLSTGK